MRLNRFLALAGVASRRACDLLIQEGRVEVNGEIVTEPGRRVDSVRDVVRCDGERRRAPRQWLFLAMHKPAGYVTTRSDELGRKTVEDLLGRYRGRVRPIGRLDRGSEGLLLFTNHGEVANRLLHPRYQQPRTYLVWLQPPPTVGDMDRVREGVPIGIGEWSGPAEVKVLGTKGDALRVRITIREGKNREVRRIFRAVGSRVNALRRIDYAGVSLAGLPPGTVRPLEPHEVAHLLEVTGVVL